jgi:regulator of RNase E activity RraA
MKNCISFIPFCVVSLLFLLPVHVFAQAGVFTKEDLIEYTPEWRGERFPDGRPKVPDGVLERIKTITIDDANDIVKKHGYEFQFEDNWERLKDNPLMVGRAVTAVFMPVRPVVHDVIRKNGEKSGHKGHYINWVVEQLVEGDVVVVDMFGKINHGTFAGGTIGGRMHKKGCQGLVIDGAGHDYPEIKVLPGFNCFCRAWSPSHQRDVMLMGINTPIRIGQATVMPGDVVLTGHSGVIFVPAHLAEEVAQGLRK